MPWPLSDLRMAVRSAAQALHEERGHFHVGHLAQAVCETRETVRTVVRNMERTGELVHVGREKRADERGWINLYELPEPTSTDDQARALRALAAVTASWADFD